ncbi:uncharacterized protein LOC144114124 [Amblyomma americanum]
MHNGKKKSDSADGRPAVPSASGGNQATASPAGPSRVSFEQALQQGVAASPPPRAVSGSQTPAAERSAQPSVEPSGYRPSYGAAAAAGAANVAASSPWSASAAAAVSGCQPAAAAPPPSPPCTSPVVVTEQTPEAGDQTTPGDDVKIRELKRTLPSHFPRRPAHGQLGRTIQLLANHFSIEIPTGSVYHYGVDISSETAQETKVPEQKKYRCLSTKINRIVIELLVKKYRQDLANCIPAFDGRKNLYTRLLVNFRERTFTVNLEEDQRSQKFVIKIQYAATVNLETLHGVFGKRVQTVPQEVLQAIDIVLRGGDAGTESQDVDPRELMDVVIGSIGEVSQPSSPQSQDDGGNSRRVPLEPSPTISPEDLSSEIQQPLYSFGPFASFVLW